MVTVFLRGGLGNQMFQYALGLNLAEKNKAELLLDTTFLNDRFPRKEFTYRTLDLDIFTLKPRLTALSKVANTIPLPAVWLSADLAFIKLRDLLGVRRIVREKDLCIFDPEVLRSSGDVLLWGRWQTEKYFSDITNDVRAAFRFRYPLKGEAKSLAEQIISSNSVSLHVRRGDYAKLKSVRRLMGETDPSYYEHAVSYIAERVKTPRFFIFSDDIAWCRENIEIPFPGIYLNSGTAGPKASFHLELMSLCRHNIIANSTFSWWAAWLNRNSQKVVIAPKFWEKDIESEKRGIIPEGWIVL